MAEFEPAGEMGIEIDPTLFIDDATRSIHFERRSNRLVLRIEGKDAPQLSTATGTGAQGLHVAGIRCPQRFVQLSKLGEGAYANVYEMRDENCGRTVAVKIPKEMASPQDLENFMNEAAVAGALEHPSIVPIYEFNQDADGQVYLCMRRIEGENLRTFLDEEHAHGANNEFYGEIVEIFSKVADAVSYAHDQGHLHLDLKPENIMIGDYGGVFVIDWGASETSSDEMCLTPAYMSPEQACGAMPNPQDDVFALGASLFHCLTGKLPTSALSLEELIRKRRKGVVDMPESRTLKQIPSRLMAIALKAMDIDVRNRYASAREFANDLRRYQQGVAVSAYRDSWLERCSRWTVRHWRQLGVAALILSLVAAFGGYIYHDRQKDASHWGDVVAEESFSGLPTDCMWLPEAGEFAIDSGVATSRYVNSILNLASLYSGSMAVELEFDYPEGIEMDEVGVRWKDPTVIGKMGTRIFSCDPANGLVRIWVDDNCVASAEASLAPGRRYRMRVELDGNDAFVYLDGRLMCSYRDEFSLPEGYLGIFSVPVGVRFFRFAVQRKNVAQRLSVLAAADSFYHQRRFYEAIVQYRQIIESHPEPKIIGEARYKLARTWLRLHNCQLAVAALNEIDERGLFAVPAMLLRCDILFEQAHHQKLISRLRTEYAAGNEALRRQIRLHWSNCVKALSAERSPEILLKYLEFQQDLFPKDPAYHDLVGSKLASLNMPKEILNRQLRSGRWRLFALKKLGRDNEIIEDPTIDRIAKIEALLKLKRYDEILTTYTQPRWLCIQALKNVSGTPAELLRKYPSQRAAIAQMLNDGGKYEQVLTEFPEERRQCAIALIRLQRYTDVLARYPDQTEQVADALRRANRQNELVRRCPLATATAEYLLQNRTPDILARTQPVNPVPRFILAMEHDDISTASRVYGLPLRAVQYFYSEQTMALQSPWKLRQLSGRDWWCHARQNGDAFLLSGLAMGLSQRGDNVVYLYRKAAGNFTFTVRIDAFRRTHTSAEVGIMLRANLTPASPQFSLFLRQYMIGAFTRLKQGGARTYQRIGEMTGPYFKLARRGQHLSAAVSQDGRRWQPCAQADFPATPQEIYCGMFIGPRTTWVPGVAVFSRVSMMNDGQ